MVNRNSRSKRRSRSRSRVKRRSRSRVKRRSRSRVKRRSRSRRRSRSQSGRRMLGGALSDILDDDTSMHIRSNLSLTEQSRLACRTIASADERRMCRQIAKNRIGRLMMGAHRKRQAYPGVLTDLVNTRGQMPSTGTIPGVNEPDDERIDRMNMINYIVKYVPMSMIPDLLEDIAYDHGFMINGRELNRRLLKNYLMMLDSDYVYIVLSSIQDKLGGNS